MSGRPAFKRALRASRGADGRKGGEGEAVASYKTSIAITAPLERQVRRRGDSQVHNVIEQVAGKREGPVPLFALLLFFLQKGTVGSRALALDDCPGLVYIHTHAHTHEPFILVLLHRSTMKLA